MNKKANISNMEVLIIIILMIMSVCCLSSLSGHKKDLHTPTKKDSILLQYHQLINDEPQYLALSYSGTAIDNKPDYKLVLLPYKNNKNKFKLRTNDANYLISIYKQLGYYDESMYDDLNGITFITNKYNLNPEQYYELVKYDDNTFIIKLSIWFKKGINQFIHINDNNKLYLNEGINHDIAKFIIL